MPVWYTFRRGQVMCKLKILKDAKCCSQTWHASRQVRLQIPNFSICVCILSFQCIFCLILKEINALKQGFSNFFSEGPDETPVQPERASCFFFFFFGGANMCAKHTLRARSAKSLAAGVRGPLKGPGSSGVIDALWCNLSLILDHLQFVWNLFYYTECNQIEACFILSHTMIKKRNKQQSLAGRSLRTTALKDGFHFDLNRSINVFIKLTCRHVCKVGIGALKLCTLSLEVRLRIPTFNISSAENQKGAIAIDFVQR